VLAFLQKRAELLPEPGRQGRIEKNIGDLLIGHRFAEKEIVLFDEGIEAIGGDHTGFRNGNGMGSEDGVVAVELLQPGPHERDTACLAPHRTAPDLDKIHDIAVVVFGGKFDNHPLLPQFPQRMHLVDQIFPDAGEIVDIQHIILVQAPRQRHFSSRHDPVGEMVPHRVIAQGHLGNDMELFFKLVQICRGTYRRFIGQAEDEITETEMVEEKAVELFSDFRRVFIDKHRGNTLGNLAIPDGRGNHQQG